MKKIDKTKNELLMKLKSLSLKYLTLKTEDEKHISGQKLEKESLRKCQQRYYSLFKNMRNGLAYCRVLFDQEQAQDIIYLEVNNAFEKLTGFKNVVGKKITEIIPGIRESDPELFRIYGKVALTGESVTMEIYIASIGAWHSATIYSPKKGYFISIFDVITGRKLAEEKILKVDRIYAIVSKINQVIVRIKDKAELLKEVCDIIIETGKFQMAWFGSGDEQTGYIKPFTYAGREDGYLSVIPKITKKDIPAGWGPTGTAIREGRHVVCNDIGNDPLMAPWREEALKRNYRAAIALPVKLFGKTIGTFTLYSCTPQFFDKEEIDLLIEVTNDISFSIESMEIEKQRKETEEALSISELRYRRLFESAKDGILILDDKSGKIVDVNPFMIELLEYNKEHFLDKELWEIGLFKDAVANKEKFLELQQKGYVRYDDLPLSTSSGKKIFVEFVSNVYSVDHQNVIQCNIRDITGRKNIEANLSAAAELAKLGYWEYEVDTGQFIFNDQYYRLIHGSSTKKQGGNIMSAEEFLKRLVYPDDASWIRKNIQETIESKDPNYLGTAEARVLQDNGDIRDVSVQYKALKNISGLTYKIYGINQDITGRKQFERELIKAKDNAEEMSRAKSYFFANMSHELRTPLIGINGFAELLIELLKEPELKEMAENILKSGKRLSETLNLILDITKFESDKVDFKLESLELVSETEAIINLYEQTVQRKGIYLRSTFSNPTIYLDTDRRAYWSILNNLINNAVKFTVEGGIIVSVSLKDNYVEIKVVDTGIGLEKKDQEIIFEEFRQASEGLNRNFEGTGLGLSITKKLVEKFAGKITVESEFGKGCAFSVLLPVTNVKVKKEMPLKDLPNPIIATNIKAVKPLALLVDDDPIVYHVMKGFLCELIDLDSIPDAEYAIKMLKEKKYDLVFMDINLRRGLDGKQATQEIRKMKGYESTPIIAVTAYAMTGDREEFLAAGCSHYISKPFTRQEILTLVKEILNVDKKDGFGVRCVKD